MEVKRKVLQAGPVTFIQPTRMLTPRDIKTVAELEARRAWFLVHSFALLYLRACVIES